MASGLTTSNLNLKPGESLKDRGEVAPDAKSFVLNLGKDTNSLCLHFSTGFNAHGDNNSIMYNIKDGGAWGAEHREPAFPFQPGSTVEVCINFDQADRTIKIPDVEPPHTEAINSMVTDGDFKTKCVAFE